MRNLWLLGPQATIGLPVGNCQRKVVTRPTADGIRSAMERVWNSPQCSFDSLAVKLASGDQIRAFETREVELSPNKTGDNDCAI